MTKQIIVITGGNVGIGYECAKNLISSQANVHIVLGCRDSSRAAVGVKNLTAFATRDNTVESKPLDLTSFKSTRAFAEDIKASFPNGIHALILNAGVMATSLRLTEDKRETNMQVNHLSQFLLAQLLLPSLTAGHTARPDEPSTVVFVSSSLHKPGVGKGKGPILTMETVDGANDFDGMVAYRNSKLNQALCMYVLAASVDSKVITVNAVCPGFIPTTDLKRESGFATRLLMNNVLAKASFATSVEEGGLRVFKAATGENRLKNGIYYMDGVENESSEESRDPTKQKLWWNWSCEVTGLESLSQK
ncbi:NAD(P)-binding protein [Linnemannia elongata AG-77]|uniref:NAD(P)-binding protein n=1 Tax=Linnemannia elongata AG-77 TaxID=1314771 RepID=A0A197JYX1_9FUNG|nr:NAD(P)-binding protein [Linnemannia elongata AG-77]